MIFRATPARHGRDNLNDRKKGVLLPVIYRIHGSERLPS